MFSPRSFLQKLQTLPAPAGRSLHGALSHGLHWAERLLDWIDGEHPRLSRWVHSAAALVQRHPRQLLALTATTFLVGTGGAFAVANLGPDPAQLPVRLIQEPVQIESLALQAEALEGVELQLRRQEVTRSSDTPESLLRRLGVMDTQALQSIRSQPAVRNALARGGRTVTAEVGDEGQLRQLTVRWLRNENDSVFQRLVMSREAHSGFSVRLETAPLSASVRMAGGVITSSLYASADEARLPDAVSSQMADIFSSQIDFHRSLRKGARYAVVYEVLEADGEPLRAGRVLSAEFINGGKTYEAVWFQENGQKGSYYSFDGKSLRRAYLAAPVAYSRKTSGFGMRLHPIFQTLRAHQGIDYAAPTGTPAFTVGDGVVEFAGVQGGYGNTVIVRHDASHSTVYAHLSRIQVRPGQQVQQGQVIGAVGSTGWSTGPHLHFEFRIGSRHVDPATLAQTHSSAPVSKAAMPLFQQRTEQARVQLAAATHMRDGLAQ
ncbi:M23 family metallopeptidase [Limnohabitans sp.]|jgi:murein DD-endopeptidase MepM/ murein hydrolase activator NlpD|uniref:M23 family metallopeptidase n=1 Tax=Limnohabitans sp. TaxID=1907725 RepID=UPI00391DE3FB